MIKLVIKSLNVFSKAYTFIRWLKPKLKNDILIEKFCAEVSSHWDFLLEVNKRSKLNNIAFD